MKASVLIVVLVALLAVSQTTTVSGQDAQTNCEPITADNLDSLQPVGTLSVTGARAVDWSSDSQLLAVVTREGTYLFATDTFAEARILPASYRRGDIIAFHPLAPLMAAAYSEVRIWDLVDDTYTVLGEPLGVPWQMAYSSDGASLAVTTSGTDAGTPLTVWGLRSSEVVKRVVAAVPGQLSLELGFTDSDASLVLVTSEEAALLNVESGRVARSFRPSGTFGRSRSIARGALNTSGDALAIMTFEGGDPVSELVLLDPITMQISGTPVLIQNGQELAFSPDGTLLAVSSGQDVAVWLIEDGTNLGSENPLVVLPRLHENTIVSMAFSPDGKYLAALGLHPEAAAGVASPNMDHTVIILGACAG